MRRLTLVLLLLSGAPRAALAQSWEVTGADGAVNLGPVAVMAEVSTINFSVKNTGGAKLAHFEVQLKNNYDISGGAAPAGWVVTTVTQGDRRIIYRALTCESALSPTSGSGLFAANVVAREGMTDLHGEYFQSFTASATAGSGPCPTAVTFAKPAKTVTWDLVSLAASLSVFPRTLSMSKSVTLTLNVTNRSKTSYTVRAPDPVSGLAFTKTSGPLPSTLPLGPGQSGTMQWQFKPEATGPFAFSTAATDGAATPQATSPTVTTPLGAVGNFTALGDISPPLVTSGQPVRFTLSVTNTGGLGPLQVVTPKAPAFSGSATAALTSGPTPASVSSLPTGASASFVWNYVVSGALGARYAFSSSASAQVDGGEPVESDVASSALGAIGSHSVSISPGQIPDGSTTVTVAYTVRNGGSLNIRTVYLYPPNATYFEAAANKYANVPAGWAAQDFNGGYQWTAGSGAEIVPGASETFQLVYARVGTGSMTANFTEQHRLQFTQADATTVRVDQPVTVAYRRTNVPEVSSLTVTSGLRRNTLTWNNPSDHDGVLVLRSTSPVVDVPAPGTEYAAGARLGAADVVYATAGGNFSSSYNDPNLTALTRYHYKVFNHDASFYYAPGGVPSAQGIFGDPTDRAAAKPLWSYNSGSPSAFQPIVQPGVGLFSADNAGRILGNFTNASNELSDGNERWRPIQLTGAVQGRFPVAELPNRSGKYLLVGDQAGKVYAINANTGTVAWQAANGAALGEAIQAPVNTDLKAGVPAVFAATRNATTATGNKVVMLSANDGSVLWTFQPGDLDMVSGAMSVDTDPVRGRRIFVASRTNGGTQPTLRIVDYVNRREVIPPVPLKYGDSDQAVVFDFDVNGVATQAIVTTNAGRVVGIALDTLQEVWSQTLSGPAKGFVMPTGGGFLATLAGAVERYVVTGTTVSQTWSAALPGPTGLAIDYPRQKLYVGCTDGYVRQVDAATGAVEKSFSVTPGHALTPPRLDSVTDRLHVGSADGRVFAFALPLP